MLARDQAGHARALYRRADDDAQWQSRLIESQSWRNVTFSAAWPDRRNRVWNERVCQVLAARAFDDDDGTVSIECAFLRTTNGKPGERTRPTTRVGVVVVDRP